MTKGLSSVSLAGFPIRGGGRFSPSKIENFLPNFLKPHGKV